MLHQTQSVFGLLGFVTQVGKVIYNDDFNTGLYDGTLKRSDEVFIKIGKAFWQLAAGVKLCPVKVLAKSVMVLIIIRVTAFELLIGQFKIAIQYGLRF